MNGEIWQEPEAEPEEAEGPLQELEDGEEELGTDDEVLEGTGHATGTADASMAVAERRFGLDCVDGGMIDEATGAFATPPATRCPLASNAQSSCV